MPCLSPMGASIWRKVAQTSSRSAWPVYMISTTSVMAAGLVNNNYVPYIQERKYDILEEEMDLILIVLVLFLLFGGGGYWGYRRWR